MKAAYPNGTLLEFPNGEVRMYTQAAQKLSKGTFVEGNGAGKVVKFKGGDRFPQGIVLEDVEKDVYTFVMIKEGKKEKPKIETL